MNSYIDCIYFTFLYGVGKNQINATSVTLHSLRQVIWRFMITWILRLPAWENAKSHSLHFFDFSTVRFQMGVEIASLSGRKVTLVAFVWLFSRVGFQIKVSSYADAKSHWFHLFDLFPLCVFKCLFKWSAWEDAKSHWLQLFDFSPPTPCSRKASCAT